MPLLELALLLLLLLLLLDSCWLTAGCCWFFFLQLNCRLYVVDEEKKVQGVVSLTDILRAVLATAEIKEGKEGKQ